MSLINRFEHLAKKPYSEKAEQLLLKVASLVKPIMVKHGWKVGTLAEMFPDNPSLLGLNVNRGAKILLRLRPHQSPDTFYDQDQLVLVMLHELTHNVHGPHDASFYKLLGELEEEWYELKRKGYSGDGFHSDGARLGGSRGTPQHIGRIKGLEAAERRRAKSTLMGRGGRLGGTPTRGVVKSPREMAVEAAERRRADDKACSHDSPSALHEAEKAAQQSTGHDAIDLTLEEEGPSAATAAEITVSGRSGGEVIDLEVSDDEPERSGDTTSIPIRGVIPPALAETEAVAVIRSARRSTDSQTPANRQSLTPSNDRGTIQTRPRDSDSIALKSKPSSKKAYLRADGTWSCPTCTLNNPAHAGRCQACEGLKPIDESVGWRCEFCWEYGSEHGFWMCRNCGAIRKRG
ncbi:hypothetical protein NliqN6_0733 [Naganishia liquefaciens]|uniref:WLM-domain-containing protein n=1 Tax=Naganishia liquefaciens TaxID=104408 RepID=A0A8H3TND4_9TREE|nr:hypothetical protein NliqN6_0733 [Naganishia liquefaciens]